MYRPLVLTAVFLIFAAPLASAADRDTEQLRAGFDNSRFNQVMTSQPEQFAAVEALVEGLEGHIDQTLDKQIETVRNTTTEFSARMEQEKLKSLLACSDLPPNFDKVKSKTTITAKAASTHRLALSKCRMAYGLLAPYLNEHPSAMVDWQKLANLIEWPQGMRMADARRAYDADIEARYQTIMGTTAQTPDASPAPADTEVPYNARPEGAPPLPSEPYGFNWDEIIMVRKHASWALDRYAPEEGRAHYNLQQCTAMLNAPRGAYTAHRTITLWSEECGKQIALGLNRDYGMNLKDFGTHYKAGFIRFEETLQKNNLSRLPSLPAAPFLFQPVEIRKYRDYMRAASASSLLLQAALENTSGPASFNPGDICQGTDPALLKTDLSNALIKSDWVGYVQRLKGCAWNIKQHYPLAGTPLVQSLEGYAAAVQAKQAQPLFR
jgi:hypothetical protein